MRTVHHFISLLVVCCSNNTTLLEQQTTNVKLHQQHPVTQSRIGKPNDNYNIDI